LSQAPGTLNLAIRKKELKSIDDKNIKLLNKIANPATSKNIDYDGHQIFWKKHLKFKQKLSRVNRNELMESMELRNSYLLSNKLSSVRNGSSMLAYKNSERVSKEFVATQTLN